MFRQLRTNDFLENGKWKCIACGNCCKFITPVVEKGFLPRSWLKTDGSCINLMADGRCRIYAIRPKICVVEKEKFSAEELAQMCEVMSANENS